MTQLDKKGAPKPMTEGKKVRRGEYPKCSHYRNGKHRFGIDRLSFQDVCLYRDKDIDNICKCGFLRKRGETR